MEKARQSRPSPLTMSPEATLSCQCMDHSQADKADICPPSIPPEAQAHTGAGFPGQDSQGRLCAIPECDVKQAACSEPASAGGIDSLGRIYMSQSPRNSTYHTAAQANTVESPFSS